MPCVYLMQSNFPAVTDYRQNYGSLDDLLDPGMLGTQLPGPPSNGMLPHQQQPPIHERHQNLTALLSSNSPQKDASSNMQSGMGNAMHTSYSGPGPGLNQYHTMMSNGPPMSSYVSSSYNNTNAGYMSSASYSTNTNQMYSQTAPSSAVYNSVSSSIPYSMSSMSNGPPNSASLHQQPPQQQSGMHPNQHMHQSVQQHPGGMMNGPTSVNVMNNSMNRSMPNNTGNPRPTQPMVRFHTCA